jgi:probable rRNA maturation factor
MPDPAEPPALELTLGNPCRYPEVRSRELTPWLRALLGELAPRADSFAVRFTSDRAMRELNHRYRGRDYATDVLSFPGGGTAEGRHLGDVVIAVPTARRQAEAAGASSGEELRRLLLHGVLHCLGYDHETDHGEMDRLERRLRRRWLGAEVGERA